MSPYRAEPRPEDYPERAARRPVDGGERIAREQIVNLREAIGDALFDDLALLEERSGE